MSCTIGYFEEEGKTYAGKNREPGKNSLDVLEIRSRSVDGPKIIFMGLDPWEENSLSESIYRAHENENIFDAKEDFDIDLYPLEPGDDVPEVLEGKLSDRIWGGLYPDRRIGKPASSAEKLVYVVPSDVGPMSGELSVVSNCSFYNFERKWGGHNEAGLSVFSSSIRHDNRLLNRPSYSVLTNEFLTKCESVDEAIAYFETRTAEYNPGAANFLLADPDRQAMIEYIPGDVMGEPGASIEISERAGHDFRTNFARDTELPGQTGFFKKPGWNFENAKNIDEVQNFLRSLNRQIVSQNYVDEFGRGIFESHQVSRELFTEQELAEEILNSFYSGEIEEIGLPDIEDFASFYSICTHPVMEEVDWKEEYTAPTYKRTQWSWWVDLGENVSRLTYDNPCINVEEEEADNSIKIDVKEVRRAVDTLI